MVVILVAIEDPWYFLLLLVLCFDEQNIGGSVSMIGKPH